jgi:hypothetical protein
VYQTRVTTKEEQEQESLDYTEHFGTFVFCYVAWWLEGRVKFIMPFRIALLQDIF